MNFPDSDEMIKDNVDKASIPVISLTYLQKKIINLKVPIL